MMKQSRSCHTFFLAISSHWKCSRNETRNTEVFTLNGLIRDSSRKPFQMQSPPRCYQPHKNSVLSFKLRPGKLECNHHTWRIQIWPIRNKQANVFLKTPQTMDAGLMEVCAFNNWYWAFAFESVLKCSCTLLCFLYFAFNSIIFWRLIMLNNWQVDKQTHLMTRRDITLD